MYDWDKFRQVIMDQYVSQNKPLGGVMQYMKEHHKFEASDRAYRMKFKEWNIQKRNRPCKKARSGPQRPNTSSRNRQTSRPLLEQVEVCDTINVAVPNHYNGHAPDELTFQRTRVPTTAMDATPQDQHITVEWKDPKVTLNIAVDESSSPQIIETLLESFDEKHTLYRKSLHRAQNVIDNSVPEFFLQLTQRALALRRDAWPDERFKRAETLRILTSHEAWTGSTSSTNSLLESFIAPMMSNPLWYESLTEAETFCMKFFFSRISSKGHRNSFNLPLADGVSFNHYMLFHTATSDLADLLVAHPNIDYMNGTHILHEFLDLCPHYGGQRKSTKSIELMKVLLQKGVDPNLHDLHGFSPLTKLLQGPEDLDVAKYLKVLLTRADPALRDAEHRSPLRQAIENFDDPMRFQLLEILLSTHSAAFSSPMRAFGTSFFPISSRWSNYLTKEFKENMEDFIRDPSYLECVVRAAVSVSTRRALEQDTADISPSNVLTRIGLIDQVITFRKELGLPELSQSTSFVSSLIRSIQPLLGAGVYPELSNAIVYGGPSTLHNPHYQGVQCSTYGMPQPMPSHPTQPLQSQWSYDG